MKLPEHISSRTRVLKYLHPLIREKLEDALDECHQLNLMAYVFESYRSPTRQQQLYNQGRVNSGRKVTNARPWRSWHNFGLAFDIVFDGQERDGIQWSWEGDYNSDVIAGKPRSDYEHVGLIMESYGFEWGARWRTFKEMPHFQYVANLGLSEAKYIYDTGGIEKVWQEVTDRNSLHTC